MGRGMDLRPVKQNRKPKNTPTQYGPTDFFFFENVQSKSMKEKPSFQQMALTVQRKMNINQSLVSYTKINLKEIIDKYKTVKL